MRIFGGSPFSTSSHSVGVAINSPSLSRPVTSAITVAGRAAGSLIFLPRFSIVPSSASSRRMRLSSTRSAFFRPNSRAISRVPTFPGCARMKATRASRSGKTLSRCFATYPLALPALFLAAVLGVGFAGEVLAVAVTGARALLAAAALSDFGLVADFFATAFLAGLLAGLVAGLVAGLLEGLGVLASASTLAGFSALAALAGF